MGGIELIAAVASIANAGLTMLQANQQAGQAQIASQMAAIQARQGELQARTIEQQGEAEALNVREALLRTLSTQQARYSAAGIVLGEGTPADLEAEVSAEAERQLGTLRTNAGITAASARISAANQAARSSMLADQSRFEALSGPIRGSLALADGYLRFQSRQPGTRGSVVTVE
jgi:hypothetical protein